MLGIETDLGNNNKGLGDERNENSMFVLEGSLNFLIAGTVCVSNM